MDVEVIVVILASLSLITTAISAVYSIALRNRSDKWEVDDLIVELNDSLEKERAVVEALEPNSGLKKLLADRLLEQETLSGQLMKIRQLNPRI